MSAPEPAVAPSTPAIDIEKLADKVYRLLAAELRLELARQGGTAGRR